MVTRDERGSVLCCHGRPMQCLQCGEDYAAELAAPPLVGSALEGQLQKLIESVSKRVALIQLCANRRGNCSSCDAQLEAIQQQLAALLAMGVASRDEKAEAVSAGTSVCQRLAAFDWCIGYELTEAQHEELDSIRVAALLAGGAHRDEKNKETKEL